MYNNLPRELRNIMLPASVLNTLKDVPAGALKVFIYLCSCNQGQPFAVTIPTITAATGIQARSVISALNTLVERQLLTRIRESGNQPNQYSIPFPTSQETAAPPSLGAATTPTRTATHMNPPPGTKSGTAPAPSPTPPPATSLEFIAVCYRPISAQEFGQLKQAYPDEAVLRKKLARLKHRGGVDPEMPLGFFLQALTDSA